MILVGLRAKKAVIIRDGGGSALNVGVRSVVDGERGFVCEGYGV